ncbi:hypothetical protein VP395_15220, partial [Mariniflexile soesokkakense]
NANLTGPITSVGNATSVASQTGTGSTFVMNTSPTLAGTPLAPTATAGTNTTQIATTAFVAVANSTNANLTGPITSVGNATSVASQTGTGSTFVMNTSPTLTGTPLAPTATAGTNTTQIATTAFVATAVNGNLVREVADEFSATASQTSFALTQTPSVNSKVKMYVNGIRISNTAYSVTGSTLTYVPANNGGYNLTAGDRIQMDFYY